MANTQDITYNLHKVVFLMDKLGDKVLQEHLNLSFSQFRIIMAISNNAVSQKDIADYWEMTEAAVSRQVEGLLNDTMIKRVENPVNRRENILSLTKKGETYLEKSFFVLDKAYESIYEHLDEREREVLVGGLHKLLKVICTNKDQDPFISCDTNNGSKTSKK